MASKYGETHDIFNNHHVQTKAKLDALLAKSTEIEVNNDGVETLLTAGNVNHASIDGKVVACNTGACVVSSSALPSGASSEAKQDTGNASLSSVDGKVVACNTGAVVVASSALPSGASVSAKQDIGNASIASVDGKVVACNTGAVVVASSALPSGGSVSSKQDEIKTLITATNSALAGTITVSGSVGGSLTKTASTPVSNEAVNGQSNYTSAEIDINTARHITIFGSSSDTANSHEVDILVSNASGGTYYETSHSGYYLNGNFHLLVNDVPYRYIKIKVKNADSAVGNSADFTIHLVHSN
jgi:hypothetical protein